MRRSRGACGRAARMVALATLVAPLSGCTQIDNFWASVPIFSMLREAPSLDPYEAPRPAPRNSVPFHSPAGEVLPAMAPTEAGLRAFAAEVSNPVAADDASLARGQALYERYCLTCHGAEGAGRNTAPVTSTGRYPPIAPPVVSPQVSGYPDGYIYGVIRVGRGLMPSYARIPHMDRWHIVNYVRTLSGEAAAQQAAPGGAAQGAAAPAEPQGQE